MATDFFKKHAWPKNESRWHFHILFDNQQKVYDMASTYAKLTKNPGLYPAIPSKWLHLTILMVGSDVDIPWADMKRVIDLLRSKLTKLDIPQLEIGPCWVWSGSVCAHVTPEEPLKKLYAIVSETAQQILGNRVKPASSFIPHVTLAYPRDSNNENETRKQLSGRWVEPVTFKPEKLTLVLQRQTPPYYTWQVSEEIPIGFSL